MGSPIAGTVLEVKVKAGDEVAEGDFQTAARIVKGSSLLPAICGQKVTSKQAHQAYFGIIRRWGEALYRRFRLYLWGSAFAFLNRGMEAYRVVLERPREASAH